MILGLGKNIGSLVILIYKIIGEKLNNKDLLILTYNEYLSCNVGDNAINEGLNEAIKDVFGADAEIYSIGLQNGLSGERSAQKNIDISDKVSDSIHKKTNIFYHAAWTIRYIFRLLLSLKKVRRASLAIVGGGGILMNNNYQFPTALFINSVIFRLFKIPYCLTGVSFSGELNFISKLMFSYFFHGACHVDVRDPGSKKRMLVDFELEVEQGADYAFCNSVNFKAKKEYDLMLNISSAVKNTLEYRCGVFKLLEKVKDKRILVLTTGDPGDEKLAKSLISDAGLGGIEFVAAKQFSDVIRCAKMSRRVIATRLHAGILSLLSGVPTSVINIGDKQVDFFVGIGLEGNVIDISSLDKYYTNYFDTEVTFLEGICSSQRNICLQMIRKMSKNIEV